MEILDEVACLLGVFVEIALNLRLLLGGITNDFPRASKCLLLSMLKPQRAARE
jgi:hypothetical protein